MYELSNIISARIEHASAVAQANQLAPLLPVVEQQRRRTSRQWKLVPLQLPAGPELALPTR